MAEYPPVDNTFGAMYIGVVVGAVLYGVTCSQVFYYFRHYSKNDGLATKSIVVTTLISDTVHQALISHTMYTYLITNYAAPETSRNIVWSLVVEVLFTGITALLVHIFYAARIWKFSDRNLPVTISIALFIAAEFVVVLVYFAKTIHMDSFTQLVTIKPISMNINALAVAADVSITVVFCTLLHRAKTNIQGSNRMITMLMVSSVQAGALTSLCAIASLVSIIAWPNTFVYICFYFLLGRLYCNSLLAALNVRKAIRERGQAGLGISLRPIGESSAGSNHEVIDIRSGSVGRIVNGGARRYSPGGVKSHVSTEDVEVIGYTKEVEVHVYDDRSPSVRSDDQAI